MASLSTLTGFAYDAGAASSARGVSIGQKFNQLLNHNPRRSLDVPDRLVVQLPRQPLNAAVAANSASLEQGLLLEPDFGRSSRQGRVSCLQDVSVRSHPCPTRIVGHATRIRPNREALQRLVLFSRNTAYGCLHGCRMCRSVSKSPGL